MGKLINNTIAVSVAGSVAGLVYAAFGEQVRGAVGRALCRRDVYRAGHEAGRVVGYEEGRRVAKPVLVPTMGEFRTAIKGSR